MHGEKIQVWFSTFTTNAAKQLLEVKPNPGHRILADLEKNFNIQIITQNVDDLHERAGSTNILHLHGELMKVRSTSPGEEVFTLTPDNYKTNPGDKCPKGFQLRPHIVWFGEAVPLIEDAIHITEHADILLIIGTSLNVYPAASLINYVKPGTPIYLIDPNEISHLPSNIKVIKKGASEGLKEFSKLILN